jgi:hypothetical protein
LGNYLGNIFLAKLEEFVGTQTYTRIFQRLLLTDGAKYLTDQTKCNWLLDAVDSQLNKIGNQNWFVLINLEIQKSTATLIFEDGNGNQHAMKQISDIDFPIERLQLYCCRHGKFWVIMLTSEY